MTDREKAIVMAYTGYTMLADDKLGIFYNYVQEKLGQNVMTHELAYQEVQDAIKEAAKEDFIAIAKADNVLEAQEPRVIDADEIVLSAEPSKWLWVERKGDYCAEAFKAGKTISGLISFDSETPGAFLYCERPDEYGKTWRCWSARPTDAQREAVEWT